MTQSTRNVFAALALLGFLLALAAHLAALSGVDVQTRFPGVWLLHAGIFVVFLPMLFASNRASGRRVTFEQVRAAVPGWVLVAGALLFAYAMLNFMLFMQAAEGGSPDLRDGGFVLQNHGRVIRQLSAAEYVALRANEVRGFSGHWLVFYFVPFAYFRFAQRSASPEPARATADPRRTR